MKTIFLKLLKEVGKMLLLISTIGIIAGTSVFASGKPKQNGDTANFVTLTGKITVSIHLLSENEEKATIEFSVKDTGIGIPLNKHEIKRSWIGCKYQFSGERAEPIRIVRYRILRLLQVRPTYFPRLGFGFPKLHCIGIRCSARQCLEIRFECPEESFVG